MKTVLLNPGPVNVSERVRAALHLPDLCHREVEYGSLQDDVRALLLGVFHLDPSEWAAVLLTGSGTAALEAAVSSCVPPGGRLLVVRNGVYGERIAEMARAHRIDTDTLDSDWTAPPDLGRLETALEHGRFDTLALVHHETTTGLLNPVAPAASLARRHRARVIVDSISGLGGEPLAFGDLDAVAGTANKCLQGLPGVSFVIVRRPHLAGIGAWPPRSVYLHLPTHARAQDEHTTAFTPAVPAMSAFRAALQELEEEGAERRASRFAHRSQALRDVMEDEGLRLLLPAPLRSNTITAVVLPSSWRYAALHDRLKERGFVVYAGQGPLAERIFRIAVMGAVTNEEYDRFSAAFRTVARDLGRPS